MGVFVNILSILIQIFVSISVLDRLIYKKVKFMKGFLSVGIFLICIFSEIYAQNIFVNIANTAPNPDGSSWITAYRSLQLAITNAPIGSNIWIAKGTYTPVHDTLGLNPTDDRDKTFYIKKTINIYGGFDGTETEISQAQPSINQTIITGEIQSNGVDTDNAYHIFTVSVSDTDISGAFNGLIFEKGYARPTVSSNPRNYGGAFFYNLTNPATNRQVNPSFENCTFRNNIAAVGGAFYFNDLGPEVSPSFKKCVFLNNTAIGTAGTLASPSGLGGVFYFNHNVNQNLTKFENCIFENNRSGNAGCIYNIAFQSSNSFIEVKSCVFSKNIATLNGGVMYSCSNGATVKNNPLFYNSVFAENTAVRQGGAFYNLSNQGETSPVYNQCTFYKNSVNENMGNGATMFNNTSVAGVAICRPKVYNSILWNQPNTVVKDIFNNITTTNTTTPKKLTTLVSHCIYSDGVVNGTLSPTDSVVFVQTKEADPLFSNTSLQVGTDGLWATADDGLALQVQSPAINTSAINNTGPITDLTGFIRKTYPYDMGAYQHQNCISPTATWLGHTADWHTATNWSSGYLPDSCTELTIDGAVSHMPQLNQSVSCKKLVLLNGATVSLGTGVLLAVWGGE